jgi:hypothetical protein
MGNMVVMQKVVMAVPTVLFPLLIKATDFWFETKKANLSGDEDKLIGGLDTDELDDRVDY